MILGRLFQICGGASPEPVVRYIADYPDERIALTQPTRTPVMEAEVLPVLKKLGLAGQYYEPEDLLGVLQRRLGLELKVLTIEDQLWCKSMLREGVRGAIRLVEDTNRGELWIPKDLDREEYADVMFHELAHVVAAHPIPLRLGEKTGQVRFWLPQKRFTNRRPPFDLAACEWDAHMRKQMLRWCEEDADSWAEHLRTFGAYGPRTYFRETVLFAP